MKEFSFLGEVFIYTRIEESYLKGSSDAHFAQVDMIL